MGGRGGCERRIEGGGREGGVRWGGRSGWWGGVRVDVNEELNVLGKFTKKKKIGGGVGSEGGGGYGWGVVRVDVNEELKFLGK